MITIFGSSGYMGSALVEECHRRKIKWKQGRHGSSAEAMEQIHGSDMVVNCCAFIPSPTVDACRFRKGETIVGNILWPYILRDACEWTGKPLAHLSTGCLFDEQREYTEGDAPTRGWDGYCGFYVGTKILCEQIVREYEKHYILRLRLPFDEIDHPKNYLTKLTKFEQVYEHTNSLTHRGDFAKWVLDLWENKAPWGTYNCVNEGQIPALDIAKKMLFRGIITKLPVFVKSEGTTGARLSCTKLQSAGVKVRPVEEAAADALKNWKHV